MDKNLKEGIRQVSRDRRGHNVLFLDIVLLFLISLPMVPLGSLVLLMRIFGWKVK